MRILVTAGEPSGDLHGARIVTELRQAFPDAEIEAVGGAKMAAAGATLRGSIDRLSAIGLVEIITKIPAHWRLYRQLVRDFRAHRYDLVIPIDYPGFHTRVARAARRRGIPVLWYIAPQFWGWWPRRVHAFRGVVDRLAVILPFETEFFQAAGLDATYVGHPLLDSDPAPTRVAARTALGVAPDARVLALFPGSRRGEVAAFWPVMRDAALELLREGRCSEVLVAATGWGEYPDAGALRIVRDEPAKVLAAANALVAKSGTTTLQAALADVPMVVVYAIHPFSARVMRHLVTARWFALPNLIAGRSVVPELLQARFTVPDVIAAITPLLEPDGEATRTQRAGLAEVRARLGGPGASGRVARLASEFVAA